jgi:AraC-like DNA-binding protein
MPPDLLGASPMLGCTMKPARNLTTTELEPPAFELVYESFSALSLMGDVRRHQALYPEMGTVEEIGDEGHFRYDFAGDRVVGRGEVCAVGEGLLLYAFEVESHQPWVTSISYPEVMRIRVSLEGAESTSRADEPAVTIDGPVVQVVLEPAGQPPARMQFTGPQKLIMLCADRGALKRYWSGREQELPALLQAFLAGTLTRTATRRLSLKADLLRCIEDVCGSEQDGVARTLFMRAKGLEILCHVLKMLEVDEGFGAAEASLQTSKAVLRAQQILKEDFASPPSLEDLAREVGVSRSSLVAGFRQIVGQSVFGYIQELRMERARELLCDTAEPIKSIASAIGYCHLSSFTFAIHRRFAMSPSELRRSVRIQ